jgi:ESS family glutamate:Na+ symporter
MRDARTIPAAYACRKAAVRERRGHSLLWRVPARVIPSSTVLSLDLVQTVAFAGVVLFAGYGIRRVVPVLARYNIPAAVVGGLLIAAILSFAASRGVTLVTFDQTLQQPLMIAFFTSIGFGASFGLLRVGGPLVVVFFVISSLTAVLQNVLGTLVAMALGQPPLMGVLAGSVTLTGGPATALAFAPQFEAAGVPASATLALAAAMAGIVAGGLTGGPIATWLIARRGLATPRAAAAHVPVVTAQSIVEERMPSAPARAPEGEDREAYAVLKTLIVMLVAMWIGGVISDWINRSLAGAGIALPAYIGAMLAAAVIRNTDDLTKLIGIPQQIVDDLGNVALSLFLVLALVTLRLWEIVHVALPLAVIVTLQVACVAALSVWAVFRRMGRDYEGAVIASGFCGFMLGTTANAMANMDAVVERYGPAPRAFLVVPMVGAFFIDFTNALVITAFLNLLR